MDNKQYTESVKQTIGDIRSDLVKKDDISEIIKLKKKKLAQLLSCKVKKVNYLLKKYDGVEKDDFKDVDELFENLRHGNDVLPLSGE